MTESTLKSMVTNAIAEEFLRIYQKPYFDIYSNKTDITTLKNISDAFGVTDAVLKMVNASYQLKVNSIILKLSSAVSPSPAIIDLDNFDYKLDKDGWIIADPEIAKPFAEALADIQRRADKVYYADNPPKACNNKESGNILNEIIPIQRIWQKFGIEPAVYEEAYKIYDFRNSGKDGYTLIDGKIQKME